MSPASTCECCGEEESGKAHSHNFIEKFRRGMYYAFIDLLGDTAKWLTIGMIAAGKFLGKRPVIIYLLSIAVCSISLGMLLNYIYFISGIDIKTTLGRAYEILPHYVKVISAVILMILMINGVVTLKKGRNK